MALSGWLVLKEKLGLREKTVVIFSGDNGTAAITAQRALHADDARRATVAGRHQAALACLATKNARGIREVECRLIRGHIGIMPSGCDAVD